MAEKHLQLKYSLLTCPCALFILLVQHYFYGQCEVQSLVSESTGRQEYPLIILRFNLMATMAFILFIILGINLQPPKKLFCFALAFWMGPLVLISGFATHCYTRGYPTVVRAATDVRAFDQSFNFTGGNRNDGGGNGQYFPNPWDQHAVLNKAPIQMATTVKNSRMNATVSPEKLSCLYKKLQKRFECCGISQYSDCTGLELDSVLVDLKKYGNENAKLGFTRGNRREHRALDTKRTKTDIKSTRNGGPTGLTGPQKKQKLCTKKCLEMSVSCVDEVINGGAHCAEAVFKVVLASFIVFAYITTVCWCHLREMDGVSIFQFGRTSKPNSDLPTTASPFFPFFRNPPAIGFGLGNTFVSTVPTPATAADGFCTLHI